MRRAGGETRVDWLRNWRASCDLFVNLICFASFPFFALPLFVLSLAPGDLDGLGHILKNQRSSRRRRFCVADSEQGEKAFLSLFAASAALCLTGKDVFADDVCQEKDTTDEPAWPLPASI